MMVPRSWLLLQEETLFFLHWALSTPVLCSVGRHNLSLRLFTLQTSLWRESRRKAAGASAYGTPTNVRDPGRVFFWHICENYLPTQSCFSHAVAGCSLISSLCISSPGTSLPTTAEHMAFQNDICISHLLMQPGVAEWLSFEQQALSVACTFWKVPFNGGTCCFFLFTPLPWRLLTLSSAFFFLHST